MQLNMKMHGDAVLPCGYYGKENPMVKSIYKVQNWIESCGKVQSPQSRVFRARSVPSSPKNKKRAKSKSKTSVVSGKSGKSATYMNKNPDIALKSTTMLNQCSNDNEIHMQAVHTSNFPVQMTTSIKKTQRSAVTPSRTCSCMLNSAKNIQGYSENSISYPIEQVAQRVNTTRCLLSGLKTEINKVKSQLNTITVAAKQNTSQQDGQANNYDVENEISVLKLQNIRLRKDLGIKTLQCAESVKDVEKAKEILSDYEKKVLSLHEQAMRSSKLMKQSKDKFCKCLKDKELEIKQLKENNEILANNIKEKENKCLEMNNEYENLRSSFQEGSHMLQTLTEDSKNFTECIKYLEKQLENATNETQKYKQEVKRLEEQIVIFECKLCQKLESKAKKHKLKLNSVMKSQEEKEEKLLDRISELSSQLEAAKGIKVAHENLQSRYDELAEQLSKHEESFKKYKILEQEYEEDCNTFRQNEENYKRDREQLRNLIDELTLVVQQNKATLLQLSAINKHQEKLLVSQTSLITDKEDKIKKAESEIEMLKKQSEDLNQEVESLKQSLTEPCMHETHLSKIEELEDVRNALNEEIDNRLVKEKIIEDQSQTIVQLQQQIKERITEINEVRNDSIAADEEIMMINEDLLKTHKELKEQISQKEILSKRFKDLQLKNSALSFQMSELEEIVHAKLGSDQKGKIERLEQEIREVKVECEAQKSKLRIEKNKAVEAAQFATQKLLDTVNDFQKQVGAQKKVQYLLTKMLHDKEEDLRTVHKRLNSINSISANLESDFPVDELYKRQQIDLSDPNTNSSYISSCSFCSRDPSCCKKCQRVRKRRYYDTILTDDEPIRG